MPKSGHNNNHYDKENYHVQSYIDLPVVLFKCSWYIFAR